MTDYGSEQFNMQGENNGTAFSGISKKIKRFYLSDGVTELSFIATATAVAVFMHLFLGDIYARILSNFETVNAFYFSSSEAKMCIEMIYTVVCVGLPFIVMYAIVNKSTDINLQYGLPQKKSDCFYLIMGGIGVCLLGSIIANYIIAFFSGFGIEFNSYNTAVAQTTQIPKNAVGFLIAVCHTAVFPAVFEEFAFRGVIMHSLKKYGDVFSIAVSAVLFGLVHGNMMQIPFAVIAGLALGYTVTVTKSIWAGVLLHFCNNFISLATTWVKAAYSFETSTAFSVVMIYGTIFVGFVCLLYYFMRHPNFIRLYPCRDKRLGVGRRTAVFFLNPFVIAALLWIFSGVIEDFIF